MPQVWRAGRIQARARVAKAHTEEKLAELPRVWFERPVLPGLVEDVHSRCQALGPAATAPDSDPFADLADAQGVIAGAMWYDGAVMDRAPGLRVIARTGIGVDRVDLAAATTRGIAVCNTPDGPTLSTAEHTVMLILAVAKRVKQSERLLRDPAGGDLFADHEGVELDDKTLGLVGFGRIAKRVAGVAAALGMRVQAFDPYLDYLGAATEANSLEHLLESSDVVSVHVPLTDENRLMFGPDQFAAMKAGAIFINTARGGLVDQQALLAALESGRLGGAGLDVSDPEPLPPDHPLLGREDVVVTPHVASATAEAKRRMLRTAFGQVVQVLKGGRPANLVNPEVWDE